MMRFVWRLAALSSLLAASSYGATRPQYGGTAHVLLRSAPNSLDPAAPQPDSFNSGNLTRLLYDTLITIDDSGNLQPGLAISWQASHDRRHWHLQLRDGVKFDDGLPVTAEVVSAALRQTNAWTVVPQGDSVEIDLADPRDWLLSELALPRNAIVKRGEGVPRGTGPFRVAEWTAGKRLVVNANEDYWAGRPFLNSIEIEFGKSYRDQEVALELGRAEVVEIAPEQGRRMETGGRHVSASAPLELVALVFARESQSANAAKLRDALALSIDRASIQQVLLGGAGEPAGGVLPNWMTGYEFLFRTETNVTKAQEERGEVNQAPVWTLAYNPSDAISQVVAERIALNARDVGLRVQASAGTNGDLQLIRIRLQSANGALALKTLSQQLGLAEPMLNSVGVTDLYEAEAELLKGQRILPLFHLPVDYGLGVSIKGWKPRRDGGWPFTDVWLAGARPVTDP